MRNLFGKLLIISLVSSSLCQAEKIWLLGIIDHPAESDIRKHYNGFENPMKVVTDATHISCVFENDKMENLGFWIAIPSDVFFYAGNPFCADVMNLNVVRDNFIEPYVVERCTAAWNQALLHMSTPGYPHPPFDTWPSSLKAMEFKLIDQRMAPVEMLSFTRYAGAMAYTSKQGTNEVSPEQSAKIWIIHSPDHECDKPINEMVTAINGVPQPIYQVIPPPIDYSAPPTGNG